MAPLPNRPRCESPSAIVPLYRVHSSSPSSKSPLCASPDTSSLGEVFLIGQRRRSYLVSRLILFLLILLTEIELHQRQFLHTLSPLLQSRFLPLARFAAVPMRLTHASRLFPEKLKELWIVPIFFLLVTGTSLGVAWLLGNLFRLRPSQRYPSLLSQEDGYLIVPTETLRWQQPHS
jgi:hypothetical protein